MASSGRLRFAKTLQKNHNDPAEVVILLATAFLWNALVYLGSRLITGQWHHYDMTTRVDRLIPFLPWTVLVYFGCYLLWVANFFLCSTRGREERYRFFCADAMAKAVCLLIFILLPTTNVRPEVVGETGGDVLMRLLYRVDAADNLFPSIHCLISWLCWLGVKGKRDIPALYRHFSLAAAVAVCISTLTTRQHVIVDVVSGVLLAEVCYWIAGKAAVCRLYSAIILRLKRLIVRR